MAPDFKLRHYPRLTMMDKILKSHITLAPERWHHYDHHALWIGAKEAIECGIASEFGEFAPPLSKPVYAFG